VSGPDGNYYVPQEGAIVGDIKAGGAGGYSGVGMTYPASGAAWSPYNAGGNSDYDYVSGCFCAGGAAGARGNGPSGACATGPVSVVPPVNSGAGGGTQTGCPSGLVAGTSAGADGGVVIEYSTGPQPSPSASPLPTASPLPSTLTVSLVWPANNGYLSAQSNGKVSASSTTPASWTATFAGGKWSLKSSFNKYLSVDNTGKVTASATAVTSAQQFDLSIASANQWTLKSSAHGTYLDSTSTGVVSATANAAAYWVRS
jgi:hypothetical protein